MPFDAEDIGRAGLHDAFLGQYRRSKAAERHTNPVNLDRLASGEDGERGAVVVDVAADGTVARDWKRAWQTRVREWAEARLTLSDERGRIQRLNAAPLLA